jgi:protein TonB
MKSLGTALVVSLAAHVTAAGGFVIGWSGAAPEDQPGVIFAEIVYETSLENAITEDRPQNAAAIKDPPVAPIEMTHQPIKSPIKLSELPDPELIILAPTLPMTSLGLQSSVQPVLALLPDEIRRDWVVPRQKPRPPSHLSGAAKSDKEINAPLPTAKQTVTPAPERFSNPQRAGGRRSGVESESVVAALPTGTEPISNSSDISAPEYAAPALGNQSPKYPYAARRRGMEGNVVIEAVVDRAGTVATAVVAVSSGHRLLDRAALSTVKRWIFHPARRRGQAVGATIAIPITFALEMASAFAQE